MAKRNQARRHATPVIALFVDIVSDYGRDILAGIATYVRNHEPWTIFGDPERVMTVLVGMIVSRRRVAVLFGAEAVGVGLHFRHPAVAGGVGRQPGGAVEVFERRIQGRLLLGRARRVLEAHQVEARQFQFQFEATAFQSHRALRFAVDMGGVLAFDLRQGGRGNADQHHRQD